MDHENPRMPSVFELLASDKLKDSLREAFRYLMNFLKQQDTFKKLPPVDETVLALDLLIEFNYLRAYRASYAENLYNLVRRNRHDSAKAPPVLPSLLCLTIIPYLAKKIEARFERLNYKETRTADELRQIRLYKILTSSVSFINLLCMVRFAAGRSEYHNFMNCLSGISLNCKAMPDRECAADEADLSLCHKLSKLSADSLGRALKIGAYVIQFLDFWNIHSNSTPLFSAALPIPRPPSMMLESLEEGTDESTHEKVTNFDNSPDMLDAPYTDEKSSSICLICEHMRQNECALSNTGYVFCYSCIYKYVRTKQRCPITGIPASLDNIVRINDIS